VAFDARNDYPLGARRPDLVTTPGGLRLADVTLDAVRTGALAADEIRATPATLSLQADVARAAGRSQLAVVPDELLLEVYTALRPRRATAEELEARAVQLDGFAAVQMAAFVREAAVAYAERGLLAEA
jgi:propanediol dehydratase small subunit